MPGLRLLTGVVATLALTSLACAQEDIPTYKALTCEKGCPVTTQPVRLNPEIHPKFPLRPMRLGQDGMVSVGFTIGDDGKPRDMIVEQLIGPQDYADAALAAVSRFLYRPATENGKPIAASWRVSFTFNLSGQTGAFVALLASYRKAVEDANTGKTTQAIAELNNLLNTQAVTLYERTMLAFAIGTIYSNAGDYASAVHQIREATINNAKYLDERDREQAIRLRIKLEAAAGEIADSFAWYDILAKDYSVPAADPAAQLIGKLHAMINGQDPLTLEGAVSSAQIDPHWQHTLLRRDFAFANIRGKLDTFDLRCDRHGIQSPVSDKAEWTVPKSWSGCLIYVRGEPGAKFQFVELQPKAN